MSRRGWLPRVGIGRGGSALRVGAIAGLSLIAAGCVQTQPVPSPSLALIDQRIADAAEKSAAASAVIAEIEVAASAPLAPAPAQMVPEGVRLPDAVTQPVSVDWQGPIEPLLQSLADLAGYRLIVAGVRQPSPPTVSLSRDEAPLWTVVRDAGTLVVDRGTVVLNPQRETIELRYESRS